jgi:RNA polymerase-binding transcription factor DksA
MAETTVAFSTDDVAIRDALHRVEADELDRIDRASEIGLPAAGAGLGILEAVRAALGRLDEGTYGTCRDCNGAIEAGRLEALPYADRCLACQARFEGRGD